VYREFNWLRIKSSALSSEHKHIEFHATRRSEPQTTLIVSHDNVIRLLAGKSTTNSNSVTSNPNVTLKISSQFTKVYPDNRTLYIIEVNVSLTTHILRAVVRKDTEENMCRISIRSHPVSGYWPTDAWYTGYREFNWKHSPDAWQATFPHTASHARQGVGKNLL
jgi:hypothetical protein